MKLHDLAPPKGATKAKQRVGQVAADIRKLRKPEPYKGKGVRYAGERVPVSYTHLSGQSGPRRLITAGGGRRKADFGAPGEDVALSLIHI